MKKAPSKVARNQPLTFFFNTGPAAQMAQKQKSRTPKSPLMQDWVFRLGLKRTFLNWNISSLYTGLRPFAGTVFVRNSLRIVSVGNPYMSTST